MHKRNRILSALLSAVLIAAPGAAYDAEPVHAAGIPAGMQDACIYENSGLRLYVPRNYDRLLETKVLQNDTKGRLFSVSEKASLSAAERTHAKIDGAGWLFSIGRVDDAKLHTMLCFDMSGAEVFAKDAEGNHYIWYHPTDVRYMRENNDAMKRDQSQWTMLTHWAGSSAREDFLKENPDLTAETFDNSEIGIYLARILYQPGTNYTISTTQYGPLQPDGCDPAPYAAQLITNASYQMTDSNETPDGEYVVLNFPEEKIRFDFFRMNGNENYVRRVWENGEILYKATFADRETKAAGVMQEWYDALVVDREMRQLGYTSDSLIGRWAEKIVGRGVIEIAPGTKKGTYDVRIQWGNSANETVVWTMTAHPAGSHAIRYEDGRQTVLTFAEDGSCTETTAYEKGIGRFVLNSANEIMWEDDTGHVADNTVFVSIE